MSGAQQAPAPGGMQRIPFPAESYAHPSLPLSQKRLVNMMVESSPADARTPTPLIATPGLLPFAAMPSQGVWAINAAMPGSVYVVSGTHAYRLSFPPRPNPGIEDLGVVGTPARPYDLVTIAVSPTACVICVPPNVFTCGNNPTGALGADPMNQVGGTFPAEGAASVCYMDGYFVFSNFQDNAQWFISALWDPSTYNALDFATADAVPNVLRLVIARAGELWLMGQLGLEVWYDSGDQDFPFRRRPGAVIVPGIIDAQSIAQIDNSVWYVGEDGIAYRTVGYQVQRVSTHPIEQIIRDQWPNVVYGVTWKARGHSFYSITQLARTFTYNCSTKVWHEQSSSDDGSQAWVIGSSSQFIGGQYLLGDRFTGGVYSPSFDVSTDGPFSGTLLRQVTLPPLWANTRRAFCARLEAEMEVGTDGSKGDVLLDWSDDGGFTWNTPRVMSAGRVADTRKRVFATRLGSFRQRVFRLTTHERTNLYAVDADISGGIS